MFKKISKGAPFTVFGIVKFSKCIIFVLKLGFLRPSTLYPNFVFFLTTGVFSMRLFFYFVFIEAPSISTRNETFFEHKGLLKVFGTLRLTGDLRQKNFREISKNLFSVFMKCFRLRKIFLLFPVGEEWFSRFMRIPSGIFWRCKIDEILTIMSFYPWFSV